MFDRSKYPHKYAPDANEFVARWTETTPTSDDIESLFLHELCETSEHEYFLAVSDVFYDAVQRQDESERQRSLALLWYRLYKAAEVGGDEALQKHYEDVLTKFTRLYTSYLSPEVETDNPTRLESIRFGALVLNALVMGDQPLARVIANNDIPLTCHNSSCESYLDAVSCPACGTDMVPYEHHSHVLHGC